MVVSFVIWRRAVYLLDVHKLRWRDKNISYTALGLIVVTAHAWYRIVLLSLETGPSYCLALVSPVTHS